MGATRPSPCEPGHWDYGLAATEIEALLARYDDGGGFGYIEYPGQTDYGMSISDLAWVQRFLGSVEAFELLDLEDGAWNGWQDAVSCRRTT